MAHLVHLVMDDEWNAARAAAQLSEFVDDQGVLSQLTARVYRAHNERPSEVARRAALTLALAAQPRMIPQTVAGG